MVIRGLFSVITGRLNDKLTSRVVVTGCGLFIGLGYLLMSQISAIWHLYLFYGVIVAIAHAVLCHNDNHGIACETNMDKALFCADPLTGLITAAVLIRPDKKLADVKARSAIKPVQRKELCCRG